MLIYEFRQTLPLSLSEYRRAHLFTFSKILKQDSGSGRGVQVTKREPFSSQHANPPAGIVLKNGLYKERTIHLGLNLPSMVTDYLLPEGVGRLQDRNWVAYPYYYNIMSDPSYMKDDFFIEGTSVVIANDRGNQENPLNLSEEDLEQRVVVKMDLGQVDVNAPDYMPELDPNFFRSKSGHGPYKAGWEDEKLGPGVEFVTCYRLTKVHFKWRLLQTQAEAMIMRMQEAILRKYNQKMICWRDEWAGMTLEEMLKYDENSDKELGQMFESLKDEKRQHDTFLDFST